jgi:hypothetical protein
MWLREWAEDVLARTTFGDQSYASLEGNWPRGVEISNLDQFLQNLADLYTE